MQNENRRVESGERDVAHQRVSESRARGLTGRLLEDKKYFSKRLIEALLHPNDYSIVL